MVRQPLAPVLRDQPGLIDDRIDVRLQRERDDIGFEPVDDGTGLRAGAAMAGAHGHGRPLCCFQSAAKAGLMAAYNSRVGS